MRGIEFDARASERTSVLFSFLLCVAKPLLIGSNGMCGVAYNLSYGFICMEIEFKSVSIRSEGELNYFCSTAYIYTINKHIDSDMYMHNFVYFIVFSC